MRIAVDARPLLYPHTGIGRYTRALLERMIPMGGEWWLYFPCKSPAGLNLGSSINLRECSLMGSSPLDHLFVQLFYPKWAITDKIDCFWSPRHHLPLLLPSKIATILTIHDLVWLKHPSTMAAGAKWLERALMPASVKKSRCLICVSKFTEREVLDLWPSAGSKAQVIYPGADFSALNTSQAKTSQPSRRFILAVATIEPRKNLNLLIEAFAGLREKNLLREDLVIVGGDGWKTTLPERSISGVHLLKNVSDERLAELYGTAEFLVQPSLYEGFGLPVAEAMNCGTPVVVPAGGVLEEVAAEAGVTFDPYSVNSLSQSILALTSQPRMLSGLREHAARRAMSFRWEEAAKETFAILRSTAR